MEGQVGERRVRLGVDHHIAQEALGDGVGESEDEASIENRGGLRNGSGSIAEKRHSGAATRRNGAEVGSEDARCQTASLSSLAARKATFLLALIWIGFAGGGVAAHAGGALAHLEDAEADDADALALLQVLGDPGDQVAQDGLGLLLGQFLVFGDRRREMLQRDGGRGRCFLRHIWPSSLLMASGN